MKKFIYIFFFSIIFISANRLAAQSFIQHNQKLIGTIRGELSKKILFNQSQLFLYGNTGADINGDKTDPSCLISPTSPYADLWVVSIDSSLNILWDKSLGGLKTEFHTDAIMGAQQNILISCYTESDSACDKTEHNRSLPNLEDDYWICALDSSGNKLWDKTLGGTDDDVNPFIAATSSGNYIICGASASGIGGDKSISTPVGHGLWLLRVDSTGHKIWEKAYCGASGVGIRDITVNNWDQMLILSLTSSPAGYDVSQFGYGDFDYWLLKLDSTGNKLWDKRFGGDTTDIPSQIIQTIDGGYIIIGTTLSHQGFDVSEVQRGNKDVWVLKLDSLGNKQWDRRYGSPVLGIPAPFLQPKNESSGARILEWPGGGYLLAATTYADSGMEVSEATYGGSDYWLIKIDSAGNKQWDQRYGGPGDDLLQDFVLMPDTSLYLFGDGDHGSSPVKPDTGHGGFDYWVIHLKYNSQIPVNAPNATAVSYQLSIHPNPCKDFVEIKTASSKRAALQQYQLSVFDITGKKIMQHDAGASYTLNTKALQSALYIVELKDKEGNAARSKLVKE